jgi:hypothetical protein
MVRWIMEMHAVKQNEFFDSGLDRKSSTGKALVVTGITVAVGNGNGNTGNRTCRPAEEGKCIFTRAGLPDMGCTGPAAPERPAKAGITGTEELFR